jgi:hypothetical protein
MSDISLNVFTDDRHFVRIILTNDLIKAQGSSTAYPEQLRAMRPYLEAFLRLKPDFSYNSILRKNINEGSWRPTLEWVKYNEKLNERYRAIIGGNDELYYYKAGVFHGDRQMLSAPAHQTRPQASNIKSNDQPKDITAMSEQELYTYITFLFNKCSMARDEVEYNNINYHLAQAYKQLSKYGIGDNGDMGLDEWYQIMSGNDDQQQRQVG